jgi:hypothetical protein
MSAWKWRRHIAASAAALRSSSMDLSSPAGRIRTSRTRFSGSSVLKELTFLSRRRLDACRVAQERMSTFSCARLQVSRPSRGATSSSRPGAVPTPPGSGLMWPELNWKLMAILKSTNAWRPVRPTSGRSENVLAAHSSPTYPLTTSGSFGTIWPGQTARPETG